MPSSPDPLLGAELMAQGENLNTWGAPKLNQVIAVLAEAVAGRAAYTVSGAYTPTSANFVGNEARRFIHDITGGTGGTVTLPGRSFVKLFRNGSAGPLSVTTGGGAAATLAAGASALLWCDGANVRRLWDNDAGGARLTNVGAGVAASDAATRGQLDAAVFGASVGAFPAVADNAGRLLRVNAVETAPEWGPQSRRVALAAGGVLAPLTPYSLDTSAARVLTLPVLASLAVGDWVELRDATGEAATNNASVTPAGADTFLGGLAAPFLLDINRGAVLFEATAAGWRVHPL